MNRKLLGFGSFLFLFARSIGFGSEPLLRGESGMYGGDDFVVGVSPRGIITGYFNEGTACTFFFSGPLEKTGYSITAWDPFNPNTRVLTGELRFRVLEERSGFFLKLPNISTIGGCGGVVPYLQKGEFLPLDLSGSWTFTRIVSAPQTNFYQSPNKARQKAYVVRGDVIHVTKTEKDWVEATYETVHGWLPESDLFPMNPPAITLEK